MAINNPQPESGTFAPRPAQQVEVSVQAPQVKQSRDRAQYVRQQKGHSFILEWFVFGIFTVFIRPIYLAFSPNHYFHI